MCIRPRDDIYTHWHWQIVNQKRNGTTHWTGSWQARPTKCNGGGVKWASSPHVGVKGHGSTTLMLNAPTYQEVPTLNLEAWHYTLQSSQAEMTEHKVMLYKIEQGVYIRPLRNTPHLTIYIDSCYTYFKLIVTVVHTRKCLYKRSWKYLFNHLECYLILVCWKLNAFI